MFGGAAPGSLGDELSGIALGTSCYGKPVPVVWGTTRIGGNVIWMPDELWVKVPGEPAGKGGDTGSQDAYYQGVALAIAEGQVTLGKVWRDKEVFTALANVETASPFTFFGGTRPQAPWSGYTTVPSLSKQATLNVPGSGPYQVTLSTPGLQVFQWLAVQTTDAHGIVINANMHQTSGVPGPNEVQIDVINPNAPVLTFNAAEAGLTVRYAYKYTVSLTGYSLGYGGTAYIVTPRLSLGSSNTLKNLSYEVNGLVGTGDQNPSDIVVDFLTNTVYGCAWPGAQLEAVLGPDGLVASGYKRYCAQAGLLLSPAMVEQRSALEYLQWLLDASNSDCVYTGDVLRIVPLGDVVVGTYTPYVTPVYSIGDNNLLGGSEEEGPVTCTRTRQQDTFNACPVEYLDSQTVDTASKYNVAVAEDVEQGDFELTNAVRKAPPLELHCITKANVAQLIARVRVQRSVHIRNKYRFKVGWQFARLEPLDLVQLTDSLSGLVNKVVRVTAVEENVDDDSFTVEAEEWPFGVATAPLFTPQTGSGGGQNVAAPAPFANPPILAVPPLAATVDGATPELWVASAGGSKDWAGAQVWLSWDGATYEYQGDVGACVSGNLNANLGSGPPIDTASTLQVDLRASGKTLASVTTAERDNLQTLCYVDGELVAYRDAALVSDGIYSLTNLLRGLKGTVAAAHTASATARFLKVDDQVVRIPLTIERFGQTAYLKLVSFNTGKTLLQDIATVPPYSVVLPSRVNALSIVHAPVKVNFDRFNRDEWDIYETNIFNCPPLDLPSGADTDLGVTAGTASAHYLRLKDPDLGLAVPKEPAQLVYKPLIAIDPRKTYALTVKLAMKTGGAPGIGPFPYAALIPVQADGITYLYKNGTTTTDAEGLVQGGNANLHKMHAPTAAFATNWQQYTSYWKGLASPGTNGTADSSAPGSFRSTTAFVRLALVLDINDDNFDAACAELQFHEVDDQVPLPGGAIVPFSVDASAKVTANTVDANRLRANIIAATHLQVGVSNNMLYNSDWASGAPTVPVDLGGGFVGGWKVIRSVAGLLTTAGMNDALARLGGNTDPQNERSLNTVYLYQNNRQASGTDSCYYISDFMPARGGAKYCASVYAGVLRCSSRIEISWYDSSKVFISTVTPPASAKLDAVEALNGGANLQDFKRVYSPATAPSNAAYAVIWLRKFDTDSGSTTSYAFFCRAMWEELPLSVDPSDSVAKGPTSPTVWQQAATTVLDQNAIKSNALQTSNYAEDGSGNPTAGAIMQARGTAVKIAPGNLQVGSLNFTDAWYNKTWFARGTFAVPATGLGSLTSGEAENVSSVTDSGNNYGTAVNAVRITWATPPPGISGTPVPNLQATLKVSSDYRLSLVIVGVGSGYVDVHMVDQSNTNAPRAWNVQVEFKYIIFFHFASGYPL